MKNYIEEAKQKFNNKYTYLSDYKKTTDQVMIRCPIHGEFSQEIRVHLKSAYGCSKCGQDAKAKTQSLSLEDFIIKAVNKFGDNYDYTKVVYKNSRTPIDIICPIHGAWSTTPGAFLQAKVGCPVCGRENTDSYHRRTLESFKLDAGEVHKGRYTYDNVVYINTSTKVSITCPICNLEFEQTPAAHLAGQGCRRCNLVGQRKSNYVDIPTAFYILKLTTGQFKYGITKTGLGKRYKHEGTKIIDSTEFITTFLDGSDAWELERKVRLAFTQHLYEGPKLFNKTGNSEILTCSPKDYVITQIKETISCQTNVNAVVPTTSETSAVGATSPFQTNALGVLSEKFK